MIRRADMRQQQAMSSISSAPLLFDHTQNPPIMWTAAETRPERDASRQRQLLLQILQEALDLIDESGICDDSFR